MAKRYRQRPSSGARTHRIGLDAAVGCIEFSCCGLQAHMHRLILELASVSPVLVTRVLSVLEQQAQVVTA